MTAKRFNKLLLSSACVLNLLLSSQACTKAFGAPYRGLEQADFKGRESFEQSTSVQSLVFSQSASHIFNGFGANVSPPGKSGSVDEIIDFVTDLQLKYVRLEYGHSFRAKLNSPGPVDVSDETMYETVGHSMQELCSRNPYLKNLYIRLHQKKVAVTMVMFQMPDNYKIVKMDNSGGATYRINPSRIHDFSQFYVAYLRALNDLEILPDGVELVNEPDGSWNPNFTPEEFSIFVHEVCAGLEAHHLLVKIYAPGTSRLTAALPYIRLLNQSGDIRKLSALSMHVYLTPNHFTHSTIKNSVSQINTPDFAQIVKVAEESGHKVVATEFGGMRNVSDAEPNASLDLKAALDLARLGATATFIWGMKGDHYSLLNSDRVPDRAFYALKALSTNVPENSKVLKLVNANTKDIAMSSLGYAAFAKGNEIVVGVANPADGKKYVRVAFEGKRDFRPTHLYNFSKDGITDTVPGSSPPGAPMLFKVDGDSGVVIKFTAVDSTEPVYSE